MKPTVRLGQHSVFVSEVQRIVGAKVDGAFGPVTLAAVKAWQTSKGLVPDGVFGPKSWEAAIGPGAPLATRLHVIDISGWQTGKADFVKAAEGPPGMPLSAGIVKATQGAGTSANKHMEYQIKGFQDQGLPVGLYHYAELESSPGVSLEQDARKEARRLVEAHCKVIPVTKGNFRPICDMEDNQGHARSGKEIGEWLFYFYNEMEVLLPHGDDHLDVLYTGFGGFWANYKGLTQACQWMTGTVLLWHAAYPKSVSPMTSKFPAPYGPFNEVSMWQYAGDPKANNLAHWPGIVGHCDRNVVKDEATFRKMLGI